MCGLVLVGWLCFLVLDVGWLCFLVGGGFSGLVSLSGLCFWWDWWLCWFDGCSFGFGLVCGLCLMVLVLALQVGFVIWLFGFVLSILVLRFNAFGCSCVLVLRWVCAGFGVWLGLDGVAGFGCLGFIAYWCLVVC